MLEVLEKSFKLVEREVLELFSGLILWFLMGNLSGFVGEILLVGLNKL